jgi:hypothetical protein
VVWVGASFTEPDACELVVTVRVDEPAVAVIVTDVALVACHVSVTFCPLLTDAVLAASVTLGADEELAWEVPPQEDKPQTANNRVPDKIQRTAEQFIIFICCLRNRHGAQIR